MDSVQLQLVEFAEFYKNVFEMPADERPSDEVIADDAELDRYMQDLSRKRAEARLKHR